MGWATALSAGASILGSVLGGRSQDRAAEAQRAEIARTRAQNQKNFETSVGYLSPYAVGGKDAYNQALAGSGALGAVAQQNYMNAFTGGPFLQGMITNAGNALNSQYAATGRSPYGGNAINALYAQNANLWNNAYQQQLQNLYTGSGQGIGAAGTIMGGSSSLANANNALTAQYGQSQQQQGQNQSNMFSSIFGTLSKGIAGMGKQTA
jgi:hypothetical protein